MDFSGNALPHLDSCPQPVAETHESLGVKRKADREVRNPKTTDMLKSCPLTSQKVGENERESGNGWLQKPLPLLKECSGEIKTQTISDRKPPLPAGLQKMMIEGYPFWYSKAKNSGPQKFVFQRADTIDHRVCIVLENWGRRLYSSFANVQHFWSYYSSFKGERCFYWLNRSFELPNESSLLHFDVEWYTPTFDPKASEKLNCICNAINSALPSPVRILREKLSRNIHNSLFKNSYHLYPLITFEHKAKVLRQE